jgi:acyl-coenzyme A synthetase/AMP-(fatty) acid ligase
MASMIVRRHARLRPEIWVGRAASGRGEEVVALVVTRGKPEHPAIVEHLARHLPADRRPHHIIYTKALPRTPNGKIDRVAVKRLAIQYADAPSNV